MLPANFWLCFLLCSKSLLILATSALIGANSASVKDIFKNPIFSKFTCSTKLFMLSSFPTNYPAGLLYNKKPRCSFKQRGFRLIKF